MPRLMDSVSLANCQVSLPIFCPVPPRTSRISNCKMCEGYQCFLFCLSFFSQFVYFLFYARFIYLMPFKCLLVSFNLWDFCPQVPYKSLVLDDEVELTKENSSQILFPWFDWKVHKPVLSNYMFRVKPLHQTSWGSISSCKLRWVTWSCRNKYRDDEESGPHQSERQLQEDRRDLNMTRRLWPSDSRHSTTEHPLTIMIQLFLWVSSSCGKVASRISYVWTSFDYFRQRGTLG